MKCFRETNTLTYWTHEFCVYSSSTLKEKEKNAECLFLISFKIMQINHVLPTKQQQQQQQQQQQNLKQNRNIKVTKMNLFGKAVVR
jgi:hypothetical protein